MTWRGDGKKYEIIEFEILSFFWVEGEEWVNGLFVAVQIFIAFPRRNTSNRKMVFS